MNATPWDAIVIGSGMGGLACAAALANTGHRVLVLEQHSVAGGHTQTFERSGFTWDVGVHYVGFGPGGPSRRILDWLCHGRIDFADLGEVYDTLHFPDGFEWRFAGPEAAQRNALKERFPESAAGIDAFFAALAAASHSSSAVFAQRAMPELMGRLYGFWHEGDVRRWWGRTTAEVLEELIADPVLRAVLAAQWGDYGGLPREASFGMHAMLMRHYFHGAWYPVGGARAFAVGLVPTVEKAGGEVRLGARVEALVLDDGAVRGVRLADGTELRAARVVSDAGVRNTVGRLLPSDALDSQWAREVLSFRPSGGHVALYLGLEGDIAAHGATRSNHWIYSTWELDERVLLRDPFEDNSPCVFVSFPSLKDPRHDPGPRLRHTAEVVAMTTWDPFAPWEDSAFGRRPEDYSAFKEAIAAALMAPFRRQFPALVPMIAWREASTPLSTVAFTGAAQGASYGIETTPRRFLSPSLRARTPIPGLFLTGQDVACPGIAGAMMGGMLAAGAIDPRVLRHLR